MLTLVDDVTGAVSLHHKEAEPFVPFHISNHTGVVLRYGRSHQGTPEFVVVPGGSESFDFWREVQGERHLLCDKHRKASSAIAVICDGWTAVEEIQIEYVGRKVYEIWPSKRVQNPWDDPANAPGLGQPLSSIPCDVTLHSLNARPDLNGRRGRAISHEADSGRYHVVLHDGGDTLALRARNLRETYVPQRPQRIIVEVSLVNDQKRISIHSTGYGTGSAHHLDVRLAAPSPTEPESVHPLPPGGTLPLPLRVDGSSYKLCLRPSSGEQDWCRPCNVPVGTADALPAATVPLVCAPNTHDALTWHCLLHSPGGVSGGVCEWAVQPTIELRNLLSGPLRFELLAYNGRVAVGRTLPAGESLRTHAFAQGTAVSFSMQVAGYAPSDRQLVAAPPSYDDEVLCRSVTLLDRHSNQLEVRIHYEMTHGCVHHSHCTPPTGSLIIRAYLSRCVSLAAHMASRAMKPPSFVRLSARIKGARRRSTASQPTNHFHSRMVVCAASTRIYPLFGCRPDGCGLMMRGMLIVRGTWLMRPAGSMLPTITLLGSRMPTCSVM